MIGPRKKNIREFPVNLIWANFTGKSFVFFYTRIPYKFLHGNPLYFFRLLVRFQKTNLEGVLKFFYSDPQLVQIFKPKRNMPEHFYMYENIYRTQRFIWKMCYRKQNYHNK